MIGPWDYATGVVAALGAIFLVVHAVMVGNPQYGWQPRAVHVRTMMVILAVPMLVRSYTIFVSHEPTNPVGRCILWAMSFLFFITWLEMMVASYRAEIERREGEAKEDVATKVLDVVTAAADKAADAAEAAKATSSQNADTLARLEGEVHATREAVSILEPAPTEFKQQIGLLKV